MVEEVSEIIEKKILEVKEMITDSMGMSSNQYYVGYLDACLDIQKEVKRKEV